jgi:hypothetical protein
LVSLRRFGFFALRCGSSHGPSPPKI